MSEEKLNRKVAVILGTDVVGYSKHIEADENLTLRTYEARESVLLALIEEYGGRVFNTGGDSVLAEFPSAVDALECATSFQTRMVEANKQPDSPMKMRFRLGINMGDVVKRGDNLLGDGVNIAARLEALSQPDGVSISKSVHDMVAQKTRHKFHDLGLQKVKETASHAFDVIMPHTQKRQGADGTKKPLLMAALAAVAVIGAIFFYVFQEQGASKPGNQVISLNGSSADQTSENSPSAKTSANKMSAPTILVMPIDVIGQSEVEGIGKGVTESLIATLSKFVGVTVLSSSTSYHVAESGIAGMNLKTAFGIDHVVSGTVQYLGDAGRINLELVDLDDGTVSWSDKRDFTAESLFRVQDELSQLLLADLAINAVVGVNQGANWANSFNTIEDYMLFLNWRQEWRRLNRQGYFASEKLLKQLVKVIPQENSAWLYVLPAWQVFQKITLGLSIDKEADLKELKNLVERASETTDMEEPYILSAIVGFYFFGLQCDEAISKVTTAIQLGGSVDTLSGAARIYGVCGDYARAIEVSKQALIRVPHDAGWSITRNLVAYYYLNGQEDEVQALIGDNINAPDMHGEVLFYFAYASEKRGDLEKAQEYLDRAKQAGTSIKNFKRSFIIKSDSHEIMQSLERLGLDQTSF